MADYIEREALLKKMKNWHEKISLIECVTSCQPQMLHQ